MDINLTPKVSICQFKISSNKDHNIEKAREYIINEANNRDIILN